MSHHGRGWVGLMAAAAGAALWVGAWLSIDWWEAHLTAVIPLVLLFVAVALGFAALILAAWGWRSLVGWIGVLIVLGVVGLTLLEYTTANVS